MAVTTGPGGDGDGDTGSKTAATTSPEEDDKHGSDEHPVSPSAVWLQTGHKELITNKRQKAAVEPPVEDKPREVAQQTQEATSGSSPNDGVEEDPRESGDGTTEKGLKASESENPRKSGDGFGADKVKLETISREEPHIADTLSEEPEVQEQAERPVRTDEPAAPSSRASSLTAPPSPEAQVPRAGPLYWRRLAARFISVAAAV